MNFSHLIRKNRGNAVVIVSNVDGYLHGSLLSLLICNDLMAPPALIENYV